MKRLARLFCAFLITVVGRSADADELVLFKEGPEGYQARIAINSAKPAAGSHFQLEVQFTINEKAYIYSPTTPVEATRTRLDLDAGSSFGLVGALQGPEPTRKQDPYSGPVEVYKGLITLTQRLSAPKTLGAHTLSGRISFQICDDKTCAQIDLPFSFPVTATTPEASIPTESLPAPALAELTRAIEGVLEEGKRGRRELDEIKEGLKLIIQANAAKGQRFDELLSYQHDDYDKAIAAAKAQNKQLFIIFTGYFCTNCRAMEGSVLIDPTVIKALRGYERLVLHLDNPNDKAEQARHRAILTRLGGQGSIPGYYIIDAAGTRLASHTGLAGVAQFKSFLEQGNPRSEVGWLGFLLSCIGLGLLTVAMPCTYPMIPITISVFSKGQKVSRAQSLSRAAVYAFGIIASYTAIGGLVQIIFGGAGQQKIQELANNGVINLGIGAIFIYFAFSFFGYYEIAMPAFLQRLMQRGQAQTDAEGGVPAWSLFLMGTFFMLTSYSCGAPFVLAVFEQAAQTPHPLAVVLALFIFSSTIALPFLLLALVPGALKSMPRAGSWFDTFKAALGFLELAFALKFLSTTDLTYGLGILTRPVFLGLWVFILGLLILNLLGVLRLAHAGPVEDHLPMGRLITTLIVAAAAIYLMSWFAGQKLEANLDALLPPHPYPNISGG